MKYMVSLKLTTDSFEDRVARFLDTGAPPPEGVEMLGRWHSVAADRLWVLASTPDPRGIFRWVTQWCDLMDFQVFPVLEDDDAAEILQGLVEHAD